MKLTTEEFVEHEREYLDEIREQVLLDVQNVSDLRMMSQVMELVVTEWREQLEESDDEYLIAKQSIIAAGAATLNLWFGEKALDWETAEVE